MREIQQQKVRRLHANHLYLGGIYALSSSLSTLNVAGVISDVSLD